jgi:hypothetical protein
MSNIIVKMKNGTVKRFMHEGRSGGSYTKTIRYEGAFAIIKDEWYTETAIPSSDIAEVVVEDHRGRGW